MKLPKTYRSLLPSVSAEEAIAGMIAGKVVRRSFCGSVAFYRWDRESSTFLSLDTASEWRPAIGFSLAGTCWLCVEERKELTDLDVVRLLSARESVWDRDGNRWSISDDRFDLNGEPAGASSDPLAMRPLFSSPPEGGE